MSKLLRLRSFRYRQTPNNLKRVKAHASRREPSTLLLVVSVNFADFQITRIKADASQYVCYISTVMLPYADSFWGFYIINYFVICKITAANIRTFSESSKYSSKFQSGQGSNSSSNSHHAPWLEASAPFEEGLPGFDTPKPNRRMG